MSAGQKAIAVVLGAIVAVNVLAAVLGEVAPEPTGDAGSSYATQPRGLKALAELAQRDGRGVRRERRTLEEASVDPRDETLVVAAPAQIGRREPGAVRDLLRRGGRVVLVGAVPPRLRDAARGAGPGLVELRDGRRVENRGLADGDNAFVALRALGPDRDVVFAEAAHGFEPVSGLAALPARWRVGLILAALAALALLWARARRLGVASEPAPEPAPSRREYVDAVAGLLRRSGGDATTAAVLRAAARERVVARAGLAYDASDDAVVTAARSLGLDEREAAGLRPGSTARDAGAALATLSRAPDRASSAA